MLKPRAKITPGWFFFPSFLAFLLLCIGPKMWAQEPPAVLHLLVGRSMVISSPARITRVSIADPNIADAIIISPTQILINGKTAGGVSLVLWDENNQSQTFELFVDLDILEISQKIREIFPEEPIRVETAKDVVILSGIVSSETVADKVLEFVSATTPKAISLMEVTPPPPAPTGTILLEVKFAEVNRAALVEHGVNLFSLRGKDIVGSTSTQQFGSIQLNQLEAGTDGNSSGEFDLGALLNIFLFSSDLNLGAIIRALRQENLLQILAEPNLLTQSGKEASFLAGGEFPFPIVQSSTAGQAISILFKEFGVRLTFTPTITLEGKIHLKVQPEVSALDFSNALTISGFLIPALSTRRVQTEMELEDGQSFAIAGLVDDRLTETLLKIPVLGDIPVLGKLFQSRSFRKSKTELLILVTPHILKPAPPGASPAGPVFPKPFLPPAAPEG